MVSRETAKKWKNGQRKPSARALELFRLHRDRRILTEEWNGFRCVDGKIWSLAGQYFNPAHLEHFGLVLEALRENDREAYERLLNKFQVA